MYLEPSVIASRQTCKHALVALCLFEARHETPPCRKPAPAGSWGGGGPGAAGGGGGAAELPFPYPSYRAVDFELGATERS